MPALPTQPRSTTRPAPTRTVAPVRAPVRTAAPAQRPAATPSPARSARPAAPTAARPVNRAARPPARTQQAAYFDYEDDPDEVVAAHATASVGTYDSFIAPSIPLYKTREGENCVRIMPRTFNAEELGVDRHWAFKIALHYGIGPDDASYLCVNQMHGEPCVLCDERRSMGDEDASKELRPGNRYLAWVIDRNNETAGPQVWAMPATLEKDICLRSRVKATGETLKISNPNNGYDITFNREGSKKLTKYAGMEISRSPSPLHDNPTTAKKWMDYITEHPLNSILNYHDQNYIIEVYGGSVERSDELTGEVAPADERPARRGMLRRPEPEPEDPAPEEEVPVDAEAASFPDPDTIMGMEEDELAQLCADNDLELDMSVYDNDLDIARESIMLHFYPEGVDPEYQPQEDEPGQEPTYEEAQPEPEPEPVRPTRQPAQRQAARPVAPQPVKQPAQRQAAVQPARTTGALSPGEQAKRRLAEMAKKRK